MKNLIVSLFFVAGAYANACVDFTGTYVFNEKTANEVQIEIKQNACASMDLTTTQKGTQPQTSSMTTDGKVTKYGSGSATDTYELISNTHTKDGLRMVDVFVNKGVFEAISETMLTKAANGDILMDIRETDAQGEVSLLKVVGTKK